MASEVVKRSLLFCQPFAQPKTAYQKLGDLTTRTVALVQSTGENAEVPAGFSEICRERGMDLSCDKRIEAQWQMAKAIFSQGPLHAEPVPSSKYNQFDNIGIYYLKNEKGEKVAVFKIGALRAWSENSALALANALGLEDSLLDSFPAVLSEPPLSSQEEPSAEGAEESEKSSLDGSEISEEELSLDAATHENESFSDNSGEENDGLFEIAFNGKRKNYRKTPKLILGLVQPYLHEAEAPSQKEAYSEESHLRFAKMVMAAVAIGLRDGKESSLTPVTKKIFDIGEEVFPTRVHPILPCRSIAELRSALEHNEINRDQVIELISHQPATTDLPLLRYLLKDGRFLADVKMPPVVLQNLAEIVIKWDFQKIRELLENQKILFFDTLSEQGIGAQDEAGSIYKLEKNRDGADQIKTIQGVRFNQKGKKGAKPPTLIIDDFGYDVANPDPNRRETRLKDAQIEATLTRLRSLQKAIIHAKVMVDLPINIVEMVTAVDPYFGEILRSLSDTPHKMSDQICSADPERNSYPLPASGSSTRYTKVVGRSPFDEKKGFRPITPKLVDGLLDRIELATPSPNGDSSYLGFPPALSRSVSDLNLNPA